MLFAYTISLAPSPATLAGLRDLVAEVNAALLPPGYGLAPLWDKVSAEGPTSEALRGYEPNVERGHLLALVHALRTLSRRAPELVISISGGHGLPPTQLREGEFEMFAEAYERALAARTGWQTPDERVLRIPS